MNIPTLLTLTRLIIGPIFIPVGCVYFLPFNNILINGALAVIFLLFSSTDMLDGYLARRLGKVTHLGAILDPIADKFLMYSTLIAMLTIHKIFFVWVLIFIGREFFIMGLRLVAYEHEIPAPVSWLGKLKTMVQTVYVTVAIANPYHNLGINLSRFNQLETGLLIGALVLSVWSAYHYYRSLEKVLKARIMNQDNPH